MTSHYYSGRGQQRPQGGGELPQVDPKSLRRPEDYRASAELAAAVDVALTLGMPLLLTGEPGSGKSGLADSVAWELFNQEPLRFVVKSDTQARDLFYRFDTVGRFHASQTTGANADPRNFIRFEALGEAILYALPADYASQTLSLPPTALKHPGTPRRSVVLIDEIDKAPRDVPNDILVEIEHLGFDIPELGASIAHNKIELGNQENPYRPIVIITSNSEKALPEPFLRRCVFHNLEFPPFRRQHAQDPRVSVEDIVASRLGKRYGADHTPFVSQALALFQYLREEAHGLEHRPTLAELLDWLNLLLPKAGDTDKGLPASLEAMDEARLVCSIGNCLLKKPQDQQRAAQLWQDWRSKPRKD